MLYRLAGENVRLLALNRFSSNERTRNSERTKNQYVYRILALSEGSFLFEDGERAVTLTKGDAVFLPPDHPYRILNTEGNFSVVNLWFTFAPGVARPTAPGITVFQDSFDPALAEGRISFSDAPSFGRLSLLVKNPSLLPLLTVLEREVTGDGQGGPLASHLLLCLFDLFFTEPGERAVPARSALVSYINEHATERLTESDLARRFSYHPAHINRLVKAETGLSFSQYLRKIRVRLAGQLLSETDMTRSEVAQYLGFYDLSHLNKTLKRDE